MTLSDANQAVNDFAQSKEIEQKFLITEQLTTNQVYILGNAANPGAYNPWRNVISLECIGSIRRIQ